MAIISIIVPVYKVEPYLDRCVESIIHQTFRDFELILVDDGSPDRCGEMCDRWAEKDSRIRVIHKENGGLSDARNAGIDVAEGAYLTFIDSDDYVHSAMLETLYHALQLFKVQVAVGGYSDTHGEALDDQIAEPEILDAETFYQNRIINATVAWGKLYSRCCFDAIRYPKGKLHEDEYVTYRILFAAEKLAFVDSPLYGYFHNDQGIIHSPWSMKRLDSLPAFEEQIAFFSEKGKIDLKRKRIREYMSNVLGQLARISQMEHPSKEGAKALKKYGRRILRRYRKDKVFVGDKDMWIYAMFYPRITHAYCTGLAILAKLRRH